MDDGELLVQMNGLRPTLVLSVTLSDMTIPLVYRTSILSLYATQA